MSDVHGGAEKEGGSREHVLLTVLGKNAQPARYRMGGERDEDGAVVEAMLAPLALIGLMPESERPSRVVALCTADAARESWPLLEQGLASLGTPCRAKPVDVPDGHRDEDVHEFMVRLVNALISESSTVALSVDVTHGLRHFAFLMYVAVLYLSALRGVEVRGAYYGLLGDDVKPFFDLRPLITLPRWIYAVEVFRDTGSAMPMAAILQAEKRSGSSERIAQQLTWLSEAQLSGLFLELGEQAKKMREQLKPFRRELAREHRVPLADELVGQVAAVLERFALEEASGDGWKGKMELSQAELVRQGRLIDDAFNLDFAPSRSLDADPRRSDVAERPLKEGLRVRICGV